MKSRVVFTVLGCILFTFSLFYSSNCSAQVAVSGNVIDLYGNPIPDVFVTFTDEGNPENEYSFVTGDEGVYEADIVSADGNEGQENPKAFTLKQNYPNPFNPSTVIPFTIDKSGVINLSIYNILGQKVKTLVSSYQTSGSYVIRWDGFDDNGSGVSAGIYIYQLRCGNQVE